MAEGITDLIKLVFHYILFPMNRIWTCVKKFWLWPTIFFFKMRNVRSCKYSRSSGGHTPFSKIPFFLEIQHVPPPSDSIFGRSYPPSFNYGVVPTMSDNENFCSTTLQPFQFEPETNTVRKKLNIFMLQLLIYYILD